MTVQILYELDSDFPSEYASRGRWASFSTRWVIDGSIIPESVWYDAGLLLADEWCRRIGQLAQSGGDAEFRFLEGSYVLNASRVGGDVKLRLTPGLNEFDVPFDALAQAHLDAAKALCVELESQGVAKSEAQAIRRTLESVIKLI